VSHRSKKGARVTDPPAILCISANPALDRRLRLPALLPGEVHRARQVESFPGGKAAHVAFAAQALGARVLWIGFLGGAIGKECEERLASLGVETLPIRTEVSTRVNCELIEDSGRITEIREAGEAPEETECAHMMRLTRQALDGSWRNASLVLSGSLPTGVSPELYKSLIQASRAVGSRSFVDTSGEALRVSLSAQPDFAKPNRAEAESLLGRKLDSIADVHRAGREIIERGARSAAVTLGAEGLIWIEGERGRAWIARPPKLTAVSTVGCGDATLAGFAFGYSLPFEGEGVLRLATACGAANCLALMEGRISKEDVDSIIRRVQIEPLD
jgi:1-phosphofructokinase family hexose kinase